MALTKAEKKQLMQDFKARYKFRKNQRLINHMDNYVRVFYGYEMVGKVPVAVFQYEVMERMGKFNYMSRVGLEERQFVLLKGKKHYGKIPEEMRLKLEQEIN